MSDSNLMTQDDMCVYKENGVVKALGWDIHSNLLKNDVPISTYYQSGGGIESTIKNLAVPAGLVILNNAIDSKTNSTSTKDIFQSVTSPFDIFSDKEMAGGDNEKVKNKKNSNSETNDVITESLYDKLLGLSNRKKYLPHKTRKNGGKKKKNTKKNNKTRRKK